MDFRFCHYFQWNNSGCKVSCRKSTWGHLGPKRKDLGKRSTSKVGQGQWLKETAMPSVEVWTRWLTQKNSFQLWDSDSSPTDRSLYLRTRTAGLSPWSHACRVHTATLFRPIKIAVCFIMVSTVSEICLKLNVCQMSVLKNLSVRHGMRDCKCSHAVSKWDWGDWIRVPASIPSIATDSPCNLGPKYRADRANPPSSERK